MKRRSPGFSLEETLQENVETNLELIEVPLSNKAIRGVSIFVLVASLLIMGRVFVLAKGQNDLYGPRAEVNSTEREEVSAPRGLIYDRYGIALVENRASFFLYLNLKEFLNHPESDNETFEDIAKILGNDPGDLWGLVADTDFQKSSGKALVAADLTEAQVIQLKGMNNPSIIVERGFRRVYPEGPAFSHILGYTAPADAEDLKANGDLGYQAVVGRTGIEALYDDALRGKPGTATEFQNARGDVLGIAHTESPEIGSPLHLTIDAELQSYFFKRLQDGLASLGRSVGVGVAMNPKNGEILALINLPSYDNNIFLEANKSKEKQELLTSSLRPLFDRAVSGLYNPGSTIKPLHGVAALAEHVIAPEKEIYSPGYLEVPNPYHPDQPSRFLDWRPQGWVNLSSALAQSSNVYFYTVGGGFGDTKGLGIVRLREWWKRFGLDRKTGVDLPGEAAGILTGPDEYEQKGRTWLLGDTYNVSIGQGDLLITPLELLNYITAIANGGTIYRPFVNKSLDAQVLTDLTEYGSAIHEVQKGMRSAVTAPLGTAHLLNDLPFSVGAKTGSAQIQNNTKVNAFFVGFAPFEDPQIAILVLVEDAREGSLNAVPIAKDVLSWYYNHRINK